MKTTQTKNALLNALLGFASLVVLAAGIKFAGSVITPFLSAIFVALLFLPLLGWLIRKKTPLPLAVIIIISVLLLLVFVLGLLGYQIFKEVSESFPDYQIQLLHKFKELTLSYPSFDTHKFQKKIYGFTQEGKTLFSALKQFMRFVSVLSFVLIITSFILMEALSIKIKLKIISGSKKIGFQTQEIIQSVSRYILIKTVASLITGSLIALLLFLLGVQNWLLLSVLAFFFNYIPTVGSIFAALPATLITWLQFDGYSMVVVVLLIYVLVNLVVGVIAEPRILGDILGISPLVIVFSLALWSFLLGPVGAFICIPLTRVIIIIFQHSGNPQLHTIAILLGNLSKDHPAFTKELERINKIRRHREQREANQK